MGVQNQEWQGGERGEVEARTKRGTPLWSRKRRKDIKGRKKKTAETYFYIVLQLNLGWIPWHWQELHLAIGVIISTQFRVVPSVQSIFVILGTDCKDGRSVPVICHCGRKVSHLHTYSPYLLCVLSSNLFDSPSSCVCIVTLAPPTTATVTFNVAIIARWGRCQLRGDAGCPIAESLLSILDDEVLSQNAWPTYVASLSTRGIYTRESY